MFYSLCRLSWKVIFSTLLCPISHITNHAEIKLSSFWCIYLIGSYCSPDFGYFRIRLNGLFYAFRNVFFFFPHFFIVRVLNVSVTLLVFMWCDVSGKELNSQIHRCPTSYWIWFLSPSISCFVFVIEARWMILQPNNNQFIDFALGTVGVLPSPNIEYVQMEKLA